VAVLFFHPFPRRSRASAALLRAAEGCPGVVFRDVYELYPRFGIDVAAEQEALLRADLIVLQHPLFWYSGPALMKEWIDAVLEYGWAYGTGGTALRGKRWLQAITSGGPEEAYRRTGSNRFTMAELLRPFEQTARLCGMEPLRPFIVHGAPALDDAALAAEGRRYRLLLEEARDGRPPPLASSEGAAEARYA